MMDFLRSLMLIVAMSVMLPFAAMARDGVPIDGPAPAQTQGDILEDLDRKAEELSEVARTAIEEFINLVGPMLTRLSRLIDGLPTYEAPEILPNGDIIMRRKHQSPEPGNTDDDGLTET